MKQLKVNYNLLIGLTTLIWVIVTVLAWSGLWYWGILASFVMMLFYLMIGGSKNGNLGSKFMFYPICVWFVVWMICFGFAQYYAKLFDGIAPTFTILGFHPSFAWIFIAWVLSVATLAVGFFVNRNLWLSKEEWEEFRRKINEINEVKS